MIPVIFSLAWPTMLEQLMQTAVQYIDTAMVGGLGTSATAAVGATTTVNWLVGSTISALAVGFLSIIAKAYGAGDEKLASRVVSQAVLATLVSGIIFTILTLSLSGMVPVWMQVDPAIQKLSSTYFFILYMPMLPRAATIIFGTALRAAGDTKTPMQIGIWVNIINVILNFILIYGVDLGVIGAAIASAIAFTVGGVAITIKLWKHPMLSPKGQSFKPDKEILRPCLKVAFPNMLQRFGTSLGYVFFASMINSLGEISTAAHTIANTVESAFYIPGGKRLRRKRQATNERPCQDEYFHRSIPDDCLRWTSLHLCPDYDEPLYQGYSGYPPRFHRSAHGCCIRTIFRCIHYH